MTDRKKVIEGLQCMSQRMVNEYDDEDLWCESCGYDHDMCMIDIVSDAIALLKEQEESIPVSWLTEKLEGHPELSYSVTDAINNVLDLWEGR